MIKGDKVKVLPNHQLRSYVDQVGVVRQWREVGIALHNIDYEYLVMFGTDGPFFWIPSRYLQRL